MRRHVVWLCVLAVLGGLALVVIYRPIAHLARTAHDDRDEREPIEYGHVDDASRLNSTPVHRIERIMSDSENQEAVLVDLLAEARSSGRRVAIAGSRHSMGGHTIYPDGIILDMSGWNEMSLDLEDSVLNVQAGATWDEVIDLLDAHGLSVSIMQSNDSFTVGGSISVNCHGWQFGRPPIASSVRSFRIMLADGDVVRCSREENAELFSLALGGYGLFGIILDVALDVVPNELYEIDQRVLSTDEALRFFDDDLAGREGLSMLYARMDVTPDSLLDELILNAFFVSSGVPKTKAGSLEDGEPSNQALSELKRIIFRGSSGSDFGKSLRWDAESRLAPMVLGRTYTRNALLDEGVEILENRSAGTTDILHEYFVPREGAEAFVDRVRQIVTGHESDLLNVTVRQVETDEDTFLRYADGPMISFVMLFVQDRNESGEEDMVEMTRELIDASLDLGGRYYLPYRLHATREQFRRAYPRSDRFFELKALYDPGELFQNQFYRRYGPVADPKQAG